MRSIYTLEVEDFTEEARDLGHRATIYGHGERLADGVGSTPDLAISEALREAGITEGEGKR